MSKTVVNIPEEFKKVVKNLINDMKTTFPEYYPLISKWWKDETDFVYIDDIIERKTKVDEYQEKSFIFYYNFCLKKFPPNILELINQSETLFSEDSQKDTEFLPNIHFKNIMSTPEITDKTREIIWKYLQLILYSVISVRNEGDGIDSLFTDSLLTESLEKIKTFFQNENKNENENDSSSQPQPPLPSIPNLSTLMGGSLGQIAKDLFQETANNLNTNNINDGNFMNTIFKNPDKIQELTKSITDKLTSKIDSGELNEIDLVKETTEVLGNIKNIPGLDNVFSLIAPLLLKQTQNNTNNSLPLSDIELSEIFDKTSKPLQQQQQQQSSSKKNNLKRRK
jgi:hypothetical protein